MGRTLALSALLATCATLAGCVYFSKHTASGACTRSLESPIRNFCEVTPGVLWRGERPSTSDARWLLAHGVRTVVNLEVLLDDRRAFTRASADAAVPVEYYHVPDFEPLHLVDWRLLDAHTARFLAIMAVAPRPVYLHCLDGIDRTGVLIATWRILVEGVPEEEALQEMARFGSPWIRVDTRYVRSLVGERRASLLRRVEKLKAEIRPAPVARN